MKKTIEHHINDIYEYLERLVASIENVSENEFSSSLDLQDATLRRIEILGEIIKKLPRNYLDKHSEIPWRDIAKTRDVLAHDYDGIDLHQIWNILINDIPKIKPQIKQLVDDGDFEYLE